MLPSDYGAVRAQSTTYDRVDVGVRSFLVRTDSIQLLPWDPSTSPGSLTIEARLMRPGPRLGPRAWKITDAADASSFDVSKRLLYTHMYGSYGALEGGRAFSLEDGSLVFAYTGYGFAHGDFRRPFSVEIPNGAFLRRQLAALTIEGIPDLRGDRLPSGEVKIAEVVYSDASVKGTRRAKLYGPEGARVRDVDIVDRSGSVNNSRERNELLLWDRSGSTDPKSLTNFGLRVSLETVPQEPQDAYVAIVDDAISIPASTLPPGFVLR